MNIELRKVQTIMYVKQRKQTIKRTKLTSDFYEIEKNHDL